ncbi:MAG: ABC transporter ATP-binding protein [Candidatus Kariarchaeaceae archaeon]|jgi:branched-chain amino acid transport system ATP-binding protein
MDNSQSIILKTDSLTKKFGGLVAVNNVSLELESGSMKSLIGPNGSGKTTFFNLITGALPPTSGKIYFENEDITSLPLNKVALKGISRSYQITNIFPNLTAFENIRLVIQSHSKEKPHFFKSLKNAGSFEGMHDEVLYNVNIVDLDPSRLYIPASLLPHAEKRKLELAMAIASKPKLLLLDEPTAGMSVEEIPEIYDAIVRIKKFNADELTVFIVEHKMDMVMKISEEVIVFSNGSLLAKGTPEEIQSDEEVLSAYLGGLDDEYS